MRGFRRVIGNVLMLRILAFLIFSQPAGILAGRLNDCIALEVQENCLSL
jgi:hypothetical protein